MSVHPIRTIIVDDEQPACEVLQSYLKDYCPEVNVIDVCRSSRKAYDSIRDLSPDLVFLDIEMPRSNGFELLKKLQPVSFRVIFITAFSEYAVKAFRFSAIDYLLKPINIRELVDAVGKVKKDLRSDSVQNIGALIENIENPAFNFRKLIIPNTKGFITIDPEEIIQCEADGYCTLFYLLNKKKISSSYNLKHYEELLPANRFFRVHNSYIINLNHIKGYNNQGEIHLTEGIKCPLGNSRKQAFLKIIRKGQG